MLLVYLKVLLAWLILRWTWISILLSFFLIVVFWLLIFFFYIIQCNNYGDITQAPDHSEELECSSHCLDRLKIVNINVISSSQHAMSLIRFILANSTSLETLTYKVGFGYRKLDAVMLSSISEELLWMKRATQSAHVKFLHWECIGFCLSTPQFFLVSFVCFLFQNQLIYWYCSSPIEQQVYQLL